VNPAVLGLTSVIDPISKLPLGSDFVTDFVLGEIPCGFVLVEIGLWAVKFTENSL
jgi:hypothetical protein